MNSFAFRLYTATNGCKHVPFQCDASTCSDGDECSDDGCSYPGSAPMGTAPLGMVSVDEGSLMGASYAYSFTPGVTPWQSFVPSSGKSIVAVYLPLSTHNMQNITVTIYAGVGMSAGPGLLKPALATSTILANVHGNYYLFELFDFATPLTVVAGKYYTLSVRFSDMVNTPSWQRTPTPSPLASSGTWTNATGDAVFSNDDFALQLFVIEGCIHSVKNCDDGISYTADSCNPGTPGGCSHALACIDDDPCSVDQLNPLTGVCSYTPLECHSGSECSTDTCNSGMYVTDGGSFFVSGSKTFIPNYPAGATYPSTVIGSPNVTGGKMVFDQGEGLYWTLPDGAEGINEFTMRMTYTPYSFVQYNYIGYFNNPVATNKSSRFIWYALCSTDRAGGVCNMLTRMFMRDGVDANKVDHKYGSWAYTIGQTYVMELDVSLVEPRAMRWFIDGKQFGSTFVPPANFSRGLGGIYELGPTGRADFSRVVLYTSVQHTVDHNVTFPTVAGGCSFNATACDDHNECTDNLCDPVKFRSPFP